MIVFIAAVAAARCRKTVVAPVYIFHIQRLAINNSQVVTNMFTQLGHYVKAAADGDLAKFNTSGFVATSTLHTAPQPLPPASFDWIDRGPVSGFKSFDLSTRGPEFFFDFLVAAIEEMDRPASNFLASQCQFRKI